MGKWNRYIISGFVLLVCTVGGFMLHSSYSHKKVIDEISMGLEGDIIMGEPDAPGNVILFFDYNCRYCKKFFNEVYPQLERDYIKRGKLKLTLRLICSGNDENALLANQTAICINKFGNFGKLHDLLMHRYDVIYSSQFNQLIESYIGANEFLGECILNSNHNDVIRNIYQFQLLKQKGTPTFVIGDEVVVGYRDYEYFKNKL